MQTMHDREAAAAAALRLLRLLLLLLLLLRALSQMVKKTAMFDSQVFALEVKQLCYDLHLASLTCCRATVKMS